MLTGSVMTGQKIMVGVAVLWLLLEAGFGMFYYFHIRKKEKWYQWIQLYGQQAQAKIEEKLRKYHQDKQEGYYTYHITYSFLTKDQQTYYGTLVLEEKEFLQKDMVVYYANNNPQENFTMYHVEAIKTEKKYFTMFAGIVTTIFIIIFVSLIVFI